MLKTFDPLTYEIVFVTRNCDEKNKFSMLY